MFKRICCTVILLSSFTIGCAPPPAKTSAKQTKAEAKSAKETKEAKHSKPAESDSANLEADLKSSLDDFAKSFAAAFNRRDAKLVASLWSPKAVHIDHATGKQS